MSRQLPSIDRLLKLPAVVQLLEHHPRNLVVAAVREAVDKVRHGVLDVPEDWAIEIAEELELRAARSLFPILNATGVILHTNLGRAPLAKSAVEAALAIATGYSNLELDVATGARGSRLDHCADLLAECAGAQAGMIVNNAAGALVLALNAIAAGRDVVISRGELIEIGGSFRIPDIIAKSGARLREIGTTNRTHLADYRDAIDDRTAAILVVHRSNFAMTGFVASPDLQELTALGRERNVPVIADVGGGLLLDLAPFGLSGEPIVSAAAAIADLVIFSGDKLLGGPQAGCLAGRADIVATLRKNPFARALRTDKLTLATLEATLALYRDPEKALREIPVLRMITESADAVRARADRLEATVPSWLEATIIPGFSMVGGGAFPTAEIPTTLVALSSAELGAHALALKLRLGRPSVLARVEADRVLLDPRTLTDDDVTGVGRALGEIVQ